MRVFGGKNLALAGPASDIIRELMAFAPSYSGGVNVAGADLSGNGFADILTSTATHSSEVRVFSGLNESLLDDFFAASSAAGIYIGAA